MKTVSLELTKQLKEAGFPQDPKESYFAWEIGTDGKPYLEKNIIEKGGDEPSYFAAPIADELLESLPNTLNRGSEIPWYLVIRKVIETVDNDEYQIFYERGFNNHIVMEFDENLADALAKMWLYLKKHNYLK